MRWLYRVLYRVEPAVSAAVDGKVAALASLELGVSAEDEAAGSRHSGLSFFGELTAGPTSATRISSAG
jgi:hypothetical protein